MTRLIEHLLAAPVAPVEAASVRDWWRATAPVRSGWRVPVEWAWASGMRADRAAFAFAAGYQAALRTLVPELPEEPVISFCATEEEGNRPRHIRTRLEVARGGGYRLSGSKRWSTLALDAGLLLVVASEGEDAEGRNRLRLVQGATASPGLTIEQMPDPGYASEVRHGRLTLDAVAVAPDAVLPGDGYARYVKPFRSAEDLCVSAAMLGYQCSVARRHGWPAERLEQLTVLAAAASTLGALEIAAAPTHVALAGWLAAARTFATETTELWAAVAAQERSRWERDERLARVAGKARDVRRERAWEAVRETEELGRAPGAPGQ